MAEKIDLFRANDGRCFYTEEEAKKWDKMLEVGRMNCIKMLQGKSSPEKIHPKIDSVIQELTPEEFEDFVVSIESINKALKNFAFRKTDDWADDYWNTTNKVPPDERQYYSIRKLNRLEKFGANYEQDLQWLRDIEVITFAPSKNNY